MTQPSWFRELSAAGKGPDWVFNATFAPGSHSILAKAVRDHAPADFGYYRATQRPCPIHIQSRSCDYDLYVDTPHYQACVDQLEGRDSSNIYVYHSIQVCGHDYQLVRGYGGVADAYGSAETVSIRALAQTPQLALTEWSIVYGGGTYNYATLISGTTAVALLEYLDQAQ